MKQSNLLILLSLSLFIISCKSDKKQKPTEQKTPSELQIKSKSMFGELPLIAKSEENPVTEDKVILGKKLYFDTILSKNQTQSCNTCHDLKTYGVDNKPTSPGDGKGTIGTRNSPSTLNAALHFVQFWDGREPHVEAQAGGPILNPVEMGMASEQEVLDRLNKVEEYKKLFAKAFPETENPITWDNLKKSIGAFERKLITPSKFDEYIAGNDTALTEQQKHGLQLFFDKGCIACHTGPALGGNTYQKFGVYADYWTLTKSKTIDNGKFDVTKKESDKYFFKVPSLRNVAKTQPYFHDGSVADLKESVKIMGELQLNKKLSDKEADDIVAFLESLTGQVDTKYLN